MNDKDQRVWDAFAAAAVAGLAFEPTRLESTIARRAADVADALMQERALRRAGPPLPVLREDL